MNGEHGYTYFTWNTRKECLCFVSGERNCQTQVGHDAHIVMLIILIDDENDVMLDILMIDDHNIVMLITLIDDHNNVLLTTY